MRLNFLKKSLAPFKHDLYSFQILTIQFSEWSDNRQNKQNSHTIFFKFYKDMMVKLEACELNFTKKIPKKNLIFFKCCLKSKKKSIVFWDTIRTNNKFKLNSKPKKE